MANVKEDLSRQEGTYGAEMIGKLKQMRVFIVGARGLGIETAKNLTLAGPHSVTVHDDEPVAIADLNTNFFLRDNHIGKPRGASVIDALQELNPNVRVSLHTGPLKPENLEGYHVVVITDNRLPITKLLEINRFCRSRTPAIVFLLGFTLGVTATLFADFGPAHQVFDLDGEAVKIFSIDHISNDKHGVVTIDGDRHLLSDGDHVKFEEVEGMSQPLGTSRVFGHDDVVLDINQTHVIRTTKHPNRFTIGDTSKLGKYVSRGVLTEVKVLHNIAFKSLDESLCNPQFVAGYMDFNKLSNPTQQHVAVMAIFAFQHLRGHLPRLHNTQDLQDVLGLAKDVVAKLKARNASSAGEKVLDVDSVDEQLVSNVVLYAQAELPAFTALFGGILAQEITKQTGKYSPIQQWFHFDAFELLSPQVPVDSAPINSRYDHQIAVFGREWQNRLERQNLFLVGCGALGCEYLKFIALSGLGSEGGVHATDDDTIELSNLSRQFLFRREHVKQSKSVTASNAARQMNPLLAKSLKSYQIRVEQKTEDVFHELFWEQLSFVVNALDNLHARKYTDSKCVLHTKPLFESGTLGTKANTAICLPHKTPSYTEGVVAGEDQGIAQCTLRNFPSLPLHCIEWAKVMFDDWFVHGPEATNSFLEDRRAFFEKAHSTPRDELDTLKLVKKWLNIRAKASPEICVQLAFEQLLEHFRDKIKDLIANFPADARNVDQVTGADLGPFWHGHKRFPTALEWNPEDSLQIDFLFHVGAIYANILNLPELKREQVEAIAKSIRAPEWKFSGTKVNVDDNSGSSSGPLDPVEEERVKEALRKELAAVAEGGKPLKPNDFEKDDDANHHVDVIHAATNLRSFNYQIQPSTLTKCRLVAGKIIPAIATTTAAITGFVGLEIYKHIKGSPLEHHRMATINLATNVFCLENLPDPIKAKTGLDPKTYMQVVAVPEGFTVWDTIVLNAPGLTLEGLLDEFARKHHGARFTLLTTGEHLIYSDAMGVDPEGKKRNEERLKKDLLQLVIEAAGPIFPPDRNYVLLEGTVDVNGDDGIVPRLKWVFK